MHCTIISPDFQIGGSPENAKAQNQYTVAELKSIEGLRREHQHLTRTGSGAPSPSNDVTVSAWVFLQHDTANVLT